MYLGSVRFFKDLIIVGAVTLVIVSAGLAVFFGVKYVTLKNSAGEAVQAIVITESNGNDTDEQQPQDIPQVNPTLDEIYGEMISKGYTDDEILAYIEGKSPEAFDKYIEQAEKIRNAPEYTRNFDELYVTPPDKSEIADKTIYLTFDDGPSENTLGILSILEKHNIKATFFMSGSESEEGKEIMKKVAEKGHTIGIHSISHDYRVIYADVDSFLADMQKTSDNIYEATGIKPDIIRFAGGSINNYNKGISSELIAEVERRGYVYFDWNVSGQDASKKATWTSVYNSVMNGVEGRNNAIVLLHNKTVSLNVTEDLIIALEKEGYSFDKLTNETKPSQFRQVQNDDTVAEKTTT